MDGFSTMAMQKAILSLGSGGIGGVMNANAEQDPNKKAEAFAKGFLLGAGGSVGAIKMLENSAKLAPQLAQVSQRLARQKVEQKAKQYAKWLSQADKIPPQAPDELYKAYDKAKRT